jgi:adenine-specific DNA-methyltransferase
MTDDIHETPSTTPNFQTELAARLAETVPEAIADGKVDVVKLQELLGSDTADASERFGLFWPGKKRALRAAQEPTTATLRPDFENSKDWDTTQNIFIEGDNLEVLKILQKHYHGKIKLIYIDPPYNTGNDFVYPDNFSEGLATYLESTRQWSEGKKVSTNPESEGRFHSNWLNMLYPRLKLARNLLTDDGVLAISIDDWELSNLLQLCREVFGDSNVINVIPVKSSETSGVKMSHVEKKLPKIKEYVVLCARNASSVHLNPLSIPKGSESASDLDAYLKYYSKIIVDPSAAVESWEIAPVKEYMTSLGMAVTDDAVRSFKLENAERMVYRTNNAGLEGLSFATETAPVTSATGLQYVWWQGKQMLFLSDYLSESLCDLWVDISTINLNKETHGIRGFRNGQKPVKLLDRIVSLVTSPNSGDVVLDFAGSGTTGQAVIERNSVDAGNRRYILIQLPEPVDRSNKEQREAAEFCDEAGLPQTISAITRERLHRAGNAAPTTVDGGFRAYALADTNFSKWRASSEVDADQLQAQLLELRDSAIDNASADALLAETLLKQGYSLTERIASADIAGLDVRVVGENLVIAYLDEHIKPTLDQLRAIVDEDPARIIVLEDAFQGDDELKTNLAQLAKSKGIELWTA